MGLLAEAALQNKLLEHLATLTTDPVTTFAWPNVAHNGAIPRLEVQHLPNTSRAATLGGSKDLPGFLVVTVVTKEGEGVINASDLAQQVIAHFEGVTLHTDDYRIRFIQPGSVSQSLPDGGELRTPVSIPYLAND